MNKLFSTLLLLLSTCAPVFLQAQEQDKKERPTHIIRCYVEGINTPEQEKKLIAEMKSRQGIEKAEYISEKKLLEVSVTIEVEEKHVFNAIAKAGYKAMAVAE